MSAVALKNIVAPKASIAKSPVGLLVPIPTSPSASTINLVDVPDGVELATTNIGVVPSSVYSIDNLPHGLVVPIPRRLLVSSQKKLALSSVTALPEVKSTDPAV